MKTHLLIINKIKVCSVLSFLSILAISCASTKGHIVKGYTDCSESAILLTELRGKTKVKLNINARDLCISGLGVTSSHIYQEDVVLKQLLFSTPAKKKIEQKWVTGSATIVKEDEIIFKCNGDKGRCQYKIHAAKDKIPLKTYSGKVKCNKKNTTIWKNNTGKSVIAILTVGDNCLNQNGTPSNSTFGGDNTRMAIVGDKEVMTFVFELQNGEKTFVNCSGQKGGCKVNASFFNM